MFTLPKLPYNLNALEPFICKETIKTHYGKHHAHYVETLNKLIKGTRYEEMPLEEIIFETSEQEGEDKKIFSNAAQTWNHTFYWNCLAPPTKTKPTAAIDASIAASFGSFAKFQGEFMKTCMELFGSGWVWLVKEADGTLSLLAMENAGTPLTEGLLPILTCDVWEHAYYLDYKNEREKYFNNYWKVINWKFVDANYTKSSEVFQNPRGRLNEGFDYIVHLPLTGNAST